MTNNKPRKRSTGSAKPLRTWARIVLEVLEARRGQELPLPLIYGAVEEHPDTRARGRSNRHVKAKVRQQLQRLRDRGRVEWVRPGVWRLPAAA